MKTQTFRSLYDQFTPEERVHLVLAAAARGDTDEAARLAEGCPRVKATIGDPAYTELLDRMKHASMEVLFQWLDVSHRVVRTRLAVMALDHRVKLAKVLVDNVPCDTKKLKIVVRESRGALVAAEAASQQWSAVWKGIEAAITRFCAERRITTEQLFAMTKRLPSAIDEAREDLDADVPADPEAEAAVYQGLCHTVPGRKTGGRG